MPQKAPESILKSVFRYLPTIIGSQVVAIIFLAFAGTVTGIGIFEAIFFIGAPTMSGGSSGAIATLPAMYSGIMGIDASKFAENQRPWQTFDGPAQR